MGMATTVQDYLRDAKIAFEVVDHPKRMTSVRIADTTHGVIARSGSSPYPVSDETHGP